MSAVAEFTARPFAAEGPQPLVREIPPGEDYPVAALGPLRPAVEAVQGSTQSPVAIPAASALSVASLAVQGFANVDTPGGAKPLSLYLLTVARSGERKTACDEALLAELTAFVKEKGREHHSALESWRNSHALWKGERDRILGEGRKRKGQGRDDARADLEALGPEPEAPPSPERTVTEPTFEGLTKKFAFGHPSLAIFSDEGGQFLGGYAMGSDNRQKTLAALNSVWGGAPIRRTRAGDGDLTLYGRRLAIHLMVQPEVARRFLADPLAEGSGFLARFLSCEPTSTIGGRLHTNSRQNAIAMAGFGARLGAILRTPEPTDPETRELLPRLLPLAPDARELLVRFSDAVEVAQAPGGALAHATAAASKTAEHACRIAGVLTLWRDLAAAEVTAADMAGGIDLAQFYLGEATRQADAALVSAEIDRAEKLRKWLLENWEEPEVLPRDVLRRAPIRALRESPAARAAIDMLEKHGWLVPLKPGELVRGKARKEAWRLVRGGAE